jgi:hypothetical protein
VKRSQEVRVAHTCNTSYSEGKDQEDIKVGASPRQIVLDPISKIANIRKGWKNGSSG